MFEVLHEKLVLNIGVTEHSHTKLQIFKCSAIKVLKHLHSSKINVLLHGVET